MKPMAVLVVALGLAGCVSLTPGGERVQILRNATAVQACTPLGPVKAISGWGGGIGAHLGYESNISALANATAAKEGDTLLLLSERTGFVLSSTGEAYRCWK